MVQVSVTRLRLRSIRFLPLFFWYAFRSLRQARAIDGCLSAAVNNSGGAFWTLTVWRDSTALRPFMQSGAHRKAMSRLAQWCDEASLVHWDQEDATPPSWREAAEHLGFDGRVSAVQYPSTAHAAGMPLGSGGSSQHVLRLNGNEVRNLRYDGRVERADIGTLTKVLVATNESGPWGDDVWWILENAEGRVSFPLGCSGEHAILERLKQDLPGFEVRGMNSAANAEFECWPQPAPLP